MLLDDLRIAARTLHKSWGFTLVAVVTLALGIGASTAIFSLVNSVLLQPLPYANPDRLVVVKHTAPGLGLSETDQSLGTYVHYRDRSRLLEEIALYNENVVNLMGEREAERVEVALVTANFFPIFGARPAVGRFFGPEDNAPGAPSVVVISHDLWRRHYGADSGIIGRTVQLNSAPKRVVGVMQPGFGFPRRGTQVWYATTIDVADAEVGLSALFYSSVGRLRPGVTAADAQVELNGLIPSLADRFADASREVLAQSGLRAIVRPLKDEIVGQAGASLWLLLGGTMLVLLIACANIANLVLIRSEHRQREVALRTALGATRRDIARYSLSESVLIAVSGSGLGLLLADTGIELLRAYGPQSLPRLDEVAVDGWALAVVAALAVGATLLFGVLPILGSRPPDLTGMLKEGASTVTSGRERQRVRGVLVASQFALALTLLVTSALLVQSLWRLKNVDLGFDPENVLTMEVALPYHPYSDYAAQAPLWHRLLAQIRMLPGVEAAGAATSLPLTGSIVDSYLEDPIIAEGAVQPPGAPAHRVLFAAATPGYLEAMGIPVVSGRVFHPVDRADATNPVLISEALARRLFGDGSALGKRLRRADYEGRAWYTVAGVVGSVRHQSVSGEPHEVVYVPILDRAAEMHPSHMSLAIRTTVPPLSLTSAVRRVVSEIDPALPMARVRTMDRIVADATARTSFTMLLLLIAATVALFLGAVGIYGIVSYTVSRRTHEIGIRIALGARGADIGRMVIRQGSIVVLAGLAVGVLIALSSSRLLRGLLFEVSPTDPATIAAMATLLVAVALVACWFPMRRAARVDPVIALRSE